MKPEPLHIHSRADYIGIAGSVLCVIHCLATPALLLGITFFGDNYLVADLHKLDFVFILVNGAAVYYATRSHQVKWVNLLLWSAFVIFSASLLLEHNWSFFRYLSYFGSLLLIVGHSLNLYFCRFYKKA